MEFEFMQETVDKLCKDMADNPHSYVITAVTFYKVGSNIEYWRDLDGSVGEIWNGRDIEKVFNEHQAKQVGEALRKLKEVVASKTQLKIIEDVNTETKLPWYKRIFG